MIRIRQKKGFEGTLIYLAPEVLKKQDYNNKIDCYSLGIVLFELLAK